MFKSFFNKLGGKPSPPPVAPPAAVEEEDHLPIFQTLAMTDEMREALFPTAPQMVSAIFERGDASAPPLEHLTRPVEYRPVQEHSFPIV